MEIEEELEFAEEEGLAVGGEVVACGGEVGEGFLVGGHAGCAGVGMGMGMVVVIFYVGDGCPVGR